jgi:23S rRNA pseudouridine2605 synthase
VARVISKLGLTSRTQATHWVRQGRVRINGQVECDPEFPVRRGLDRLEIDGHEPVPAERLMLMLNKPRGLVTSADDERGRDTVYSCFAGAALPWLAPVGRLDKASEGLLLFTNAPEWAARITDPTTGPDKTYPVQIDRLPEASLLAGLAGGVKIGTEHLCVKSVQALRAGLKHSWLEIVLDEGRNRQIRRLLATFEVSVLRIVRVAVGPVLLGNLPQRRWRKLTEREITSLCAKT